MRRLRALLKRELGVHARDDRGQTVLIVAGVAVGVALTAAAVFLNLESGKRIIERMKAGNARQSSAAPALIAYYLQSSGSSGTNGALPCPDVKDTPDGTAAATCTGLSGSPNAGVLPWKDIGLSRDQAVDQYGNYYTYVVSKDARNFCRKVANDYSSTSTLTGTLDSTAASISVQTVSGTSLVDTGQKVPFALISHGKNTLGARSATNNDLQATASVGEVANKHPAKGGTISADAAVTAVVTGPFTGSTGDTPFDDQVYVPSTGSLEKVCLSLNGQASVTATLTETFGNNSGNFDSAKVDTGQSGATVALAQQAVNGARVSSTNYVASFAGGVALSTSAANYVFDPTVRPVHVEALWTPNPSPAAPSAADLTCSSNDPGMSIATRVTPGDRTASSDIFGANGFHGITFRFYTSGTGFGTNTISIRDQSGQLASSSASVNTADQDFTLTCNKIYRIEAYDDGNRLWGRITQTDDATNSATVYTSGVTSDLDGDNRVSFIGGGTHLNYIDDVVIGPAMLSAEMGATGSVRAGTGQTVQSILTPSAATTPTLQATFEAMVRLNRYPTTRGVIMGQWSGADTAANNSFRISVDATGTVGVDLAGKQVILTDVNTTPLTTADDVYIDTDVTESHKFGAISLDEWTMVTVTYLNSSQTISVYLNGVLSGTASSKISVTGDVHGITNDRGIFVGAHNFYVGADADGTANYFPGSISDVRLWNGARTTVNIASTYRSRLSYLSTGVTEGSVALALNWKLDADLYNGDINVTTTGAAAANLTGVNTATFTGSPAGTFMNTTRYIASLKAFIPPFADENSLCPTHSVAGVFQCDLRARSSNSFAETSASVIVPSNLQSIYAKLWAGGGGGHYNSTGPFRSAGGGGGFTGGRIFGAYTGAATTVPAANQTFTVAVGGPGRGNGTTATDGGGGGAATAILQNTTRVVLAAGGGGGASFSNNSLLTACSTAVSTSLQCGIGGGGAGTGATPNRGVDNSLVVCGGRDGSTTSFLSTDPPNRLCYSGGAAPLLGSTPATGGTGAGTAIGGVASLGSAGGSGGAGYTAAALVGGAGGGGGGGGVGAVNSSTFVPTSGGAGAGAYGQLRYATITVTSTTPVAGDIITLSFNNATLFAGAYAPNPHVFTYTVQDTTTTDTNALAIAQHIKENLDLDATLTNAAVDIRAAYNGASPTNPFYLIQEGNNTATALTASVAAPAASETATLCGSGPNIGKFSGNAASATCTVTIGGTPRQGDQISLVFSNSHAAAGLSPAYTFTYTVTALDTTTALLATNMALAITTNPTLLATSISGAAVGSVITVTDLLNNANATEIANPVTITAASPSVAVAASPASPSTFTSAGTTNGFGGGGGAGYTQSTGAVLNPVGSAALTDLYGTPARGFGYGTATITATPAGGETITLSFRNTATSTPTVVTPVAPITATLNGASTPTSVATDLVTQINADANLRAAGITATNAAGVITYRWTGSASYNPFSVDVLATVSDGDAAGIAFYPGTSATANGAGTANGYTTGYDIYYSPSYATGVSAAPAAGGTAGLSGTSGPNGTAGAAVIIW